MESRTTQTLEYRAPPAQRAGPDVPQVLIGLFWLLMAVPAAVVAIGALMLTVGLALQPDRALPPATSAFMFLLLIALTLLMAFLAGGFVRMGWRRLRL